MVTVAHLTKQLIRKGMLIDDYLKEGLISYAALAEKFRPRIEAELGIKVKVSTIAMTLRRYSEESDSQAKRKNLEMSSLKDADIIMKGNLCDIVVYKSSQLFQKLRRIYELVDYNKGDILNIVHGDYTVSIITNEKFEKRCIAILMDEKVGKIEKNLAALSVKFGEDFLYTPGITYSLLKQLVLENINLIEIVSSLIEITFIIDKKDGIRGYKALQEFIEKV